MKNENVHRTLEKERVTKETAIRLSLAVDGGQDIRIASGQPFFDHLLHQLAFHAGWDLTVEAVGDLHVDDHHLVEDVALALGAALQEAWRAKKGMRRYGQRLLPMDDALILCAVDLSGRPFCNVALSLSREFVGNLATEMIPHFFHSLSVAGAFNLHIRQMSGSNHHHLLEACFKALGRALREALTHEGLDVSTKGAL